MHGDLAARNILLNSQGKGKDHHLVAKVADFGLSKNLYQNVYYKKSERKMLPWKWMAFEFFQTEKLTMKSDVWSYGVILWEIFSLGLTPYAGQTCDEVVVRLLNGYFLQCPKEIHKLSSWPASAIYNDVSGKCFKIDAQQRATFSELVQIIGSKLDVDEVKQYQRSQQGYIEHRQSLQSTETRERLTNATNIFVS